MENQGLFLFPGARVLIYFEKKAFLGHANIYNRFKVSVKENEMPTEKNSSRASIFATKASYISN